MTQETLKCVLAYDPETGVFTWKLRDLQGRGNKIFNTKYAGKEAGCLCPRGYRYIRIRPLGFYSASRLAWLYIKGEWPAEEIDHKNGIPSDNRFENLRAATRSENAANRGRHRNNKSGFKGVCKRRGKWHATVRMNGKRYRLGSFETAAQAHSAYVSKAKEIQKEFARP